MEFSRSHLQNNCCLYIFTRQGCAAAPDATQILGLWTHLYLLMKHFCLLQYTFRKMCDILVELKSTYCWHTFDRP